MDVWQWLRRGWVIVAAVLFAALAPSLARYVYPIPYRDAVEMAAAESGLDPFLIVAVMRVESGFRPHVESGKGARGLMQIMPETGEWLALQLGQDRFHPDMLFEPAMNLRMGAWYLAHLQHIFGGRLTPALAAYNGGQGNVSRWLHEQRWDGLPETIDRIPFPETRTFVHRVLTTHRRYVSLYRGRWTHSQQPHRTDD